MEPVKSFEKSRGELWTRICASPPFLFVLRALGVIVVIGVLAGVGRSNASGSAPLAAASIPSSPPPPVSSIPAEVPAAPAPTPPAAKPAIESPTRAGAASAEAPVYLNQADRAELRRLPGVGPKRADAILALRERLGRFHRLEDLLRVKGIGRTTLKRWRPMIRLEPPPDAGAPS